MEAAVQNTVNTAFKITSLLEHLQTSKQNA